KMAAGSSGGPGAPCRHHAQLGACESRAKYREGWRPRAVKVPGSGGGESQLWHLEHLLPLLLHCPVYRAVSCSHSGLVWPLFQLHNHFLFSFLNLLPQRHYHHFSLAWPWPVAHPSLEPTRDWLQKNQCKPNYRCILMKVLLCCCFKDCFVLKKVEGPKKTASKNSEHDCPWNTSGSHVASNWDPSSFTSSPGVSHNTAYPSGNQNQSLLTSPHYDNNCAEISGYFGHNTSVTPSVHPGGHTPPASLIHPRMVPAYNGIDRFMPRTTHLQERKRKREEGNKFSLIGTSEDNTEVVIGPQLPEIPKVDMDDESLNTSATLIRNKLKEVADSVSTSVEKPESSSAKPLVKQRRRI
ncbi:RBM48 protein, partial [Sylvia atricapilla]|nr:RBM48 protein [Sylvia atricapilla]